MIRDYLCTDRSYSQFHLQTISQRYCDFCPKGDTLLMKAALPKPPPSLPLSLTWESLSNTLWKITVLFWISHQWCTNTPPLRQQPQEHSKTELSRSMGWYEHIFFLYYKIAPALLAIWKQIPSETGTVRFDFNLSLTGEQINPKYNILQYNSSYEVMYQHNNNFMHSPVLFARVVPACVCFSDLGGQNSYDIHKQNEIQLQERKRKQSLIINSTKGSNTLYALIK